MPVNAIAIPYLLQTSITLSSQPGGSVRDDNVIDVCNKYGMAMAFTGIRLFHH